MLDLPRDAAGLATDHGAVAADEHCHVLATRLTLCHGSTAEARPFGQSPRGHEPEHAFGAG
jgi:hypothetical protein